MSPARRAARTAILSIGCMVCGVSIEAEDGKERRDRVRPETARIPEHVHPHRPGRPAHPGNIGSAARAMKNMGLDELWLVAPERFPATKPTCSCGGRRRRAANARGRAGLCVDAIADCGLIVGTTRAAAAFAMAHRRAARSRAAKSQRQPTTSEVAILFGSERTGLENDELRQCHTLLHDSDRRRLHLAESRDGGAGGRLRGAAWRCAAGPPSTRAVLHRAAGERRRDGKVLRASRAACSTRSTFAIAPAPVT